MPYKACFHCELLFEVDQTGGVTCTECGSELVDYEPEADEVEQLNEEAAEGETLMLSAEEVASSESSGVVATMAIEGLADKLRRLAAEKGDPDALLPPRERPASRKPSERPAPVPVAVDISPRSVQPVTPSFGDADMPPTSGLDPVVQPPPSTRPAGVGGARSTKMLDVAEIKEGEWPDWKDEAPSAPPVARPVPVPVPTPQPMVPVQAQRAQPTPRGAPTYAPPKAPKRRKKKAGLLIVMVVLVGAIGGGVAAWFLTRTQDAPEDPGPVAPVTEADAPQTFDERFAAQLEQASTKLPRFARAQRLDEGPYLIGGLEGLFFSEGQVPGLASARITEGMVGTEQGREFVRPLRDAFNRSGIPKGKPFALALDRKVLARDVLRVAWSAHLAGAQDLSLVARPRDESGLGVVTFQIHATTGAPPADGRVVVRVGRLGLRVTVRDARDEVISQGEPRIDRLDDGELDLDALDARLDALVKAHAGVRVAMVHPMSEMTHEQLVAVIGRLARGPDGQRFPAVRVAVP